MARSGGPELTMLVDSYNIGGTAPCPDAPLVGQWWPR